MKLLKLAGALAASAVFGSAAYANPTITLTNPDFPAPGAAWTGFDWAQGGTAYTQGFVPAANDLFSLTFFAHAVALQNGGANLATPLLDTNANGAGDSGKTYEYTIVSTINERVQSCVGTTCSFVVLGGTWDIFYDLAMDAKSTAGSLGTGFGNGTKVLAGTWLSDPVPQTFTYTGTGGQALAALTGTVTYTDGTMFAPDLVGTNAVSTLQLGNRQTSYTDPGGYAGQTWAQIGADVVFQADANQAFVPEPGVLALVGIGLTVFGAASRRRKVI